MSHYGPPGGPYPDQQPDRWADRQPSEPYREPSDPWGGNEPWGETPAGRAEQPWQDRGTEQAWPGGAGQQQPWQGGTEQAWQGGAGQPPPTGSDWQGYGQQPSSADQNWHTPTGTGWAGAAEQTWQQSPSGPAAGQQPPAGAPPAWEPTAAPGRSGRSGGGLSGGLLAVLLGVTLLLCGGGAAGIYLMTRPDSTEGNQDELAVPTAGPQVDASVEPPAEPTATPDPDQATATPTPTSSNDARFVTVGQCVRNEAVAEEETPVLTITDCDEGAYEVLARFDGVTDGEEDAKTKCADVTGYTNWYFFNSQLDALDFVLCLKQR
ncbi:hypothetical protein O7623_19825 [Solwaraspora sp. WMMD791]|uniref:LppU/SCO3897 family protein n=1 Tax=Solwaraspora sp. WMMD791 TaxID=3016086 RepID=UPI00249AA384|nr:hypothetical protein [Solwaraspora sp. WMMD791]WFE25622.1 hypothetical protein O7623_19825 [Solwaraspora sp. WMMD791]